jgi:hypothetical protein
VTKQEGHLVDALAGATYYALAPGVASYQIGFTMVVPLLVVALVWLHRRLWRPVQWALVIVLACAGPTGYLIFGGAQWWAWGQLAIFPFVLLVAARGVDRTPRGARFQQWYCGLRDGPWGPP